MEVGGFHGDAALCHHPAGNRAVDAAGKEQHGFSRRPDGHAAGARDGLGENVDLMAHLHPKKHIRVVDVDSRVGVGV